MSPLAQNRTPHDEEETEQRLDTGSQNAAGALKEFLDGRVLNSATLFGIVPVGTAIGRVLGKLVALPQLRKLVGDEIPWTPLAKPVRQSTVALISTGGVHLASDRPFNVNGDPTFRVIPKDTPARDLTISHQAYDNRDALRDINLVFPIERLRELEAEGVIGRLADTHYGFGLMPSARRFLPSLREVARRIRTAGVDLALLVPA
jgi:D-proline reductase (dithiol) PrdB